MDRRKQAILTHLAAYRYSLRSIIEEHVIGGNASNELQELKKPQDGPPLITVYARLLEGGRSVYQLTRAGAREVSRPVSVADVPKPQSLIANLSLLWFCFNGDAKRFRLEPADQAELLDDAQDEGSQRVVSYHVLEPREKGSFIYRVYVPAPGTKKAKIETKLYEYAVVSRKGKKSSAFIAAGRYGVVVLVQNADRAKAVTDWLHRSGRKSRRVTELVAVQVIVVPDFLLPVSSSRARKVLNAHDTTKIKETLLGLEPEEGDPKT